MYDCAWCLVTYSIFGDIYICTKKKQNIYDGYYYSVQLVIQDSDAE